MESGVNKVIVSPMETVAPFDGAETRVGKACQTSVLSIVSVFEQSYLDWQWWVFTWGRYNKRLSERINLIQAQRYVEWTWERALLER